MSGRRSSPDVLFVVGIQRSGSTLLERLLDQVDGCFGAGEVRRIWRSPLDAMYCGCGLIVAECEVWREVLARLAATAPDPTRPLEPGATYRSRVLRRIQLREPAMAVAGVRALHEDRRRFAGELARLHQAIAAATGSDVVVDTSKRPLDGAIMAESALLRSRLVHLMRDPRAVAHSLAKEVDRGYTVDRREMPRKGPWGAGWSWTVRQLVCERIARGTPSVRLRYEDLAADPAGGVRAVLDGIVEAPQLDFIVGSKATLRSGHGLAGNPMRAGGETVEVRVDDAWRSAMAPGARRAVNAATWPLRHRYHYVP